MTIDTAKEREYIENTHDPVWMMEGRDRMLALCDELDAAREELVQAGKEVDQLSELQVAEHSARLRNHELVLEAQREHQDTKDELRRTRADVLKLRDGWLRTILIREVAILADDAKTLADTEHYEQYR